MSSAASIQIYDAQAKELAERYDRLSLLESYGCIEELIRPSHPAPLALDVGAGSGRDAAWLLSLGYEVVAVEPAAGMRAEGERRHSDPKIHWLDDQMPGLAAVHETAQELRVGSAFAADRAVMISRAIGEAVSTIAAMPANFIRFPNSDQRVFTAFRARSRTGSTELLIDLPTLAGWGRLRIPGAIWRTMARLGSWIEPVLVNEWARLMRGYAERMGVSIPAGQAEAALVWEEPFRNTALGRSAAQRIFAEGRDIYCAWSATKLRPSQLDIDHCMPWSAWPCGDLWNLLPSERRVNQHQKRERLPSGELLLNSRERIIGWWNDAWLSSPTLSQRFWREASAALFVVEPSEPEQLFAGLEWRRLRLRQDQLVPEWTGEQRV